MRGSTVLPKIFSIFLLESLEATPFNTVKSCLDFPYKVFNLS